MELVSVATGTLLLHWLQKRGRILTEIKVWSSNCLRVIICAIKNLGHSTRRTDLPRIAPGTPRTSGKESFALFMRRLGPLSCEPLCPPPRADPPASSSSFPITQTIYTDLDAIRQQLLPPTSGRFTTISMMRFSVPWLPDCSHLARSRNYRRTRPHLNAALPQQVGPLISESCQPVVEHYSQVLVQNSYQRNLGRLP